MLPLSPASTTLGLLRRANAEGPRRPHNAVASKTIDLPRWNLFNLIRLLETGNSQFAHTAVTIAFVYHPIHSVRVLTRRPRALKGFFVKTVNAEQFLTLQRR